MPEVSYRTIEPLISQAEQHGEELHIVFCCPLSGHMLESRERLHKGRGLGDVAADAAKKSAASTARRSILGAVRGVLGYGLLGRAGAEVAGSVIASAGQAQTPSFSDDEKQAAAVRAFEAVRSRYIWDGAQKRWVSAAAAEEVATDFAKQLETTPVEKQYDREVLARMLVEIANADGRLEPQELQFLGEFVPEDLGTMDELSARALLSSAELAETSVGPVRDTMLMLAWSLALCDEDLDVREKDRLNTLAQGLGIASARVADLKRSAQSYVLDQALDAAYANDHRDDVAFDEAMALAKKIGLDGEAAERVDIRHRRRQTLRL